MKKFVTPIVIAVSIFTAALARAEVAVRHATTSENEFQALSQALGYTPVSEFLSEKSGVSDEAAELHRSRMIEAQAEWLRVKGSGEKLKSGDSLSNINRFLELASTADWSETDRASFITFYLRKYSRIEPGSPEARKILAQLAAIAGVEVNLSAGADSRARFNRAEIPAGFDDAWTAYTKSLREKGRTLSSALPTDIVLLKVGGRAVARRDLPTLILSGEPTRVTFISNAYQPVTKIISGGDKEWPALTRTPWMADDCGISSLPAAFGEVKMKALGFAACKDDLAKTGLAKNQGANQTATRDRAEIEKFGLSRDSHDPLDLPGPSLPPLLKRPWVWGAIGVLAVGAVIAIQANDRNRTVSVQPSNNEGW